MFDEEKYGPMPKKSTLDKVYIRGDDETSIFK